MIYKIFDENLESLNEAKIVSSEDLSIYERVREEKNMDG